MGFFTRREEPKGQEEAPQAEEGRDGARRRTLTIEERPQRLQGRGLRAAYWLLSEKGFIAAVRDKADISLAEDEAGGAFQRAVFQGKGRPVVLRGTLAGLGLIRSWFEKMLDDNPLDEEVAQAAVVIREVERKAKRRRSRLRTSSGKR